MDKDEARAREVLAAALRQDVELFNAWALEQNMMDVCDVQGSTAIIAMLAFAAEARADQKERDAALAEKVAADNWTAGCDGTSALFVGQAIRSQDHD